MAILNSTEGTDYKGIQLVKFHWTIHVGEASFICGLLIKKADRSFFKS